MLAGKLVHRHWITWFCARMQSKSFLPPITWFCATEIFILIFCTVLLSFHMQLVFNTLLFTSSCIYSQTHCHCVWAASATSAAPGAPQPGRNPPPHCLGNEFVGLWSGDGREMMPPGWRKRREGGRGQKWRLKLELRGEKEGKKSGSEKQNHVIK